MNYTDTGPQNATRASEHGSNLWLSDKKLQALQMWPTDTKLHTGSYMYSQLSLIVNLKNSKSIRMKSSLSKDQSHRKYLGLDLDLVSRAANEKPTDNIK